MECINKLLNESFPSNPNEIVIKNKFYPYGLTTKKIFEYYMKYKMKILKYCNNKTIVLVLYIDNERIFKRQHKCKDIQLTNSNYDFYINGHINSIFIEQQINTNTIVLDIDCDKNYINRKELLKFVKYFLKDINFKYQLNSTSSNGFQLSYKVQTTNIDELRYLTYCFVEKYLKKHKNDFKYDISISDQRIKKHITIGLNCLREHSLYLCPYSLNKDFLMSHIIDKNKGI